MNLKLIRKEFTTESTIGELFVNDAFECFVLEDKVRDFGKNGEGKVYGKTAIPKGKYEVVISYSNRFKQIMPLLVNVPYFEGIRIHAGNDSEATHGCLLTGTTKAKDFVGNSKIAYNKLFARIKAVSKFEKIFIEIV